MTFDLLHYVHEAERLARADGWTVRFLNPTETPLGLVSRPWFQKVSPGSKRRFYLSTGIHGDEVAGPLAVLEMLANSDFFQGFEVVLFPILNPHGLAVRKRENEAGLDLNRDYKNTQSAEISGHIEVLKTLTRFDAGMMLHEDYEGTGAYLFELNDGLREGVGRDIIVAMGKHVPIDERPEIDEMKAHLGIICRKDLIEARGPIEERPQWPEAIYLAVHLSKVTYTTESPMLQPLPQRVAAQVAAVERLLQELRQA